jgi:short-subunit dehydrogenase
MVVVVTGASMGIGRSLALAWARRGATVVLSARSKDALEGVAKEVTAAGGKPIVAEADVTKEEDRVRLVAIAESAGGVDVLANNAGRGFYAPALDVDVDQMRDLFELNVVAPLRLAQLAAPQLERKRGTIVMLSSVAGVVAAPRYAAYSASKFALEAISMSMRAELADKGIRIVVVRPGPVKTPFRANATRSEGVTGLSKEPDPASQDPDEVAELTVRAVERETAVVETSAFVRAASAAARFAPWGLRIALRRMARKEATG